MFSVRYATMPFALLLKLCGDPAPDDDDVVPWEPDAGITDAGVTDAGGTDAGVMDAGVTDAGVTDAGATDAGVTDAGVREVLRGPPGLYVDDLCEKLAPGVRPYAPRFALWADGADKERFVVLPEGALIDAADANLWRYPAGTRFYKTFSIGSLKVETRIMEKTGTGFGADTWSFRAYAWLPDQKHVELVGADGRPDVLGTTHDIPTVAQCRSCHSLASQDAVNGFSAIQLNYPRAGVSLAMLLHEGQLASPLGNGLLGAAVIPGDDSAQAALGYLHSNCGNCHGGPDPRGGLTLRLSVGQPVLESSDPYRSAVGQPLRNWPGHVQSNGEPITLRIAPGAPLASGIIARMSIRGSRDQMPRIGTEVADADGIDLVSAWIESL